MKGKNNLSWIELQDRVKKIKLQQSRTGFNIEIAIIKVPKTHSNNLQKKIPKLEIKSFFFVKND